MARVITDFKKPEPSYETFNNEEEHPDKIKYVNKLAKEGNLHWFKGNGFIIGDYQIRL